jgi:hypothetical protein
MFMGRVCALFVSLWFPVVCLAQQSEARDSGSSRQDLPGMEHDDMSQMAMGHGSMNMLPDNLVEEVVHHATAGTSAEPNSTPIPMLMTAKDGWSLMFHGNVFVLDEQQSSSRGGDKFFSTSWFMGMAQHKAGAGTFTARLMLSLEPATISGRQYPLLFQQGETAFGKPIEDGQHPHDFFMELAALYDLRLGEKNLLSFYFAPMGDPAMGPSSYAHRASASENPVGTLGHHQQDSTHIADDVVTVGVTHGILRIEGSGFHGREPDEFRWDLDSGKIDSWSTRLTVQPGANWSGQLSYARLTSPEALFPSEDQARLTASLMYNRRLQHGNWASSLVWGRTRSIADNAKFNSYLLESTLRFHGHDSVWTRIENAERSNELLIGKQPLPANFEERPIGHVQGYTFGYDHDFNVVPHWATALGLQFTTYGVPGVLQPIYGSHPIGVIAFLRVRPYSGTVR